MARWLTPLIRRFLFRPQVGEPSTSRGDPMETVIIETEVPESVASALAHLVADQRAHLRRVVSAAVVEFTEAAAASAPAATPDSWDHFLQHSSGFAVEGLPTDFSVNHDHYLHGAPRRDPAP